MTSAKKIVAFLLMLAFFEVSLAVVYKVGDSAGWTTGIDYSQWTATKIFSVGDSVLFQYDNLVHNVMQVTLDDFQSCSVSITPGIAHYTSGSDHVTLERPGHFYFICTGPGHCEAGQRVDVFVISEPIINRTESKA